MAPRKRTGWDGSHPLCLSQLLGGLLRLIRLLRPSAHGLSPPPAVSSRRRAVQSVVLRPPASQGGRTGHSTVSPQTTLSRPASRRKGTPAPFAAVCGSSWNVGLGQLPCAWGRRDGRATPAIAGRASPATRAGGVRRGACRSASRHAPRSRGRSPRAGSPASRRGRSPVRCSGTP